MNGRELGGGFDGPGRDVLKLKGQHIHFRRKGAYRLQVLVGRSRLPIGHLPRRRVSVGGERMDTIAHLASLESEHPSELSTSEYTDRGTGQDALHLIFALRTVL